jgi:autotransporter-associated beta strand protein
VTGNSVIERASGGATIALGDLSRSGIVTLNIVGTGIGTTTTPNDESGKLPAWVTVDGAPASKDGSGNIIVYSNFSDINRLGGKIANNPPANIRILDGGTVGDITPLATGVTTISSLLQNAIGGTTTISLGVDDTLRLGAVGEITVPSGSSPLVIQSGKLTAGGTDDGFGDFSMSVDGSLTVLSPISNNGEGVVALAKTGTGTLTLGGNNTYSGGTTLTGGTLLINHEHALGSGQFDLKGGTIDNTSGAAITIGDTIAQQWDADVTFTGTNDLTFPAGTVTLGANRIVTVTGGSLTLGGAVNGAFTLTKNGAGTLSIGSGSWTGTTTVNGGTLEVLTKASDVAYVVNQGATLKLGYVTGGGYANTNMKVYGDGVAATTGLYLKGGASYNCSGNLELLNAPTTIRHYGEGLAALGQFDINGAGLTVSAAASGSVIDPNIQLVSMGYGMAMTVASGANTAIGDLIIGGPLNAGVLGLNKKGTGSILLQSPGAPGNTEVRIIGGSLITGVANALGENSLLQIATGTVLKLNGFSQAASNLSGAGSVINGSPTAAILTIKEVGETGTTFSGVLGGASADDRNFGFTKTGPAQLTLDAINTYVGDTSVEAGILNLTQAYLADGSAVRITTGATLNLAHGAADTVNTLFVDGIQKPAGTYTSGNSTFITGSGSLVVTTGPAGYDTWAMQIPDIAQRGRGNDPDGDGFTNQQEFLFGTSPIASSGPLVSTEKSGSTLILRWLQRESGAGYVIKESTTLAADSWVDSALVPVPGDQTGVPTDYDRLQVTIPIDSVRKFVRVVGSEN